MQYGTEILRQKLKRDVDKQSQTLKILSRQLSAILQEDELLNRYERTDTIMSILTEALFKVLEARTALELVREAIED
jgi:hypothetical protein